MGGGPRGSRGGGPRGNRFTSHSDLRGEWSRADPFAVVYYRTYRSREYLCPNHTINLP